MSEQFLFAVLGVMAMIGGVGVLVVRHPLQAALSMLLTIISISGLFALLSAPFLFAIEIIIYAGAVVVLIMFVVMFLNFDEKHLPKEGPDIKNIVTGSIFLIPINYLILKEVIKLKDASKPLDIITLGDIKPFGEVLFSKWLVPFELVSILLLVVVVGAVVLGKRSKA